MAERRAQSAERGAQYHLPQGAIMKKLLFVLTLSVLASPAVAQAPASQTPVADALRLYLKQFNGNLVAAVDDFPVSKFNYAPTSPQQTVATVVEHLAGSNNFLCSSVG